MPRTPEFRVVVLAVVLAHAALLIEFAVPTALRMPSGRPEGAPMFVRVMATLPGEATRIGNSETPAPPRAPEAAPRQPDPEAKDAGGGAAGSSQSPAAAIAPSPPTPKGLAAGDRTGDALLDYLPRNRLSAAPQPLSSIDVAFPDGVAGRVNLKVQATLFIDENGVVRSVNIENPDTPARFAQAVTDTFLAARFKPGEVQTVPVRSQVRIEVEFRATR